MFHSGVLVLNPNFQLMIATSSWCGPWSAAGSSDGSGSKISAISMEAWTQFPAPDFAGIWGNEPSDSLSLSFSRSLFPSISNKRNFFFII